MVDLGPRKILFDTGADSEAFFSNLRKLGVDFEEVTDLVFSHKHSDHIAGLKEVVGRVKKEGRLFLPKGFSLKKIPCDVKTEVVEEFMEIGPKIYSFVLKEGMRLYEQALVLQTQKGLVVITGCAHPGIIEILEVAKKRLEQPIYLVLGGFHLFNQRKGKIERIVNGFKELGVQRVAPCHCSGEKAIEQFQEAFQDRFHKVGTGTILIPVEERV